MFPEMPDPNARPESSANCIRRLFSLPGKWKGLLSVLVIVTLFTVALDLALPLFLERCVNALGYAGTMFFDRRAFMSGFCLFAADIVLSALLGYLHGIFSSSLSIRMASELRRKVVDKLLRLPLSSMEELSGGDLMSRVVNDCDLAARALTEVLLTLFASMIVITGCAVIMVRKSPLLGLITIGASLISVLITGLLSGHLMPRILKRQASYGALNAHADETLRFYRTCVAGGRREDNLAHMRDKCEEVYRNSIHAAWLESAMEPLMLFFGSLTFVLVILFGAREAARGVIGIGTLQAFVLFSREFMEPVGELGPCLAQLQAALAGAERVFAVLDLETEEELWKHLSSGKQLNQPGRESGSLLSFRGTEFAYRKRHPVLKGLTVGIRRGERAAVIGESGAGKTTMASLATGLYSGYGGGIYFEGREIRGYALTDLRSMITFVSQEPQMIDGTVLENILCGCDGASAEDAMRAARITGIEEFISKLPAGYQTYLPGITESLSQGQLQLICIARAVLRDADLVIFDEATSSVDSATEAALEKAFRVLLEGKTSIRIAHKLNTVRNADRIHVLNHGVIAESGTHEELLKDNGLYAAMYRRQINEPVQEAAHI